MFNQQGSSMEENAAELAPPLRLKRIPTMKWQFFNNQRAHGTERFIIVVESKNKRQLNDTQNTNIQGPKMDYNLSYWRMCQVPASEHMNENMEGVEEDRDYKAQYKRE